MTRALTDFQVDILALAESGLSNREIAASTERPFACIITTLSNIKRKGYKLPMRRPLDATPEKALGRLDRKWQASPAPRFTAKGVRKSTGEKFTVTSDDQAHSDKWLAAMLGWRQ